ncbi:cell division protein FtsI [Pseudoclavibacter endophyticus]|uniref:Penicillin-binding protein 2 n=1 Tax=Pseudoclavibacter endophyticus TaxID=1778590 RepID=A0A6H9WHG3_9MICO|nr:penicillin-binding transpeptidase domain-containing protein [Pseudoclavibacter endophyticus]KAB1648743.1 penicillin-binding protein 2 [Pseudoclavibacter endophyticus]GGA68894.1 cell division protein FtsI [Pseudoclavibacter endophyticus]
MSQHLRIVGAVVLVMFLSLFTSTTIIQVVAERELNEDPRNYRTVVANYEIQRGPILVDGVPIAYSVPIESDYQYQRTYAEGELYSALTGYYTYGLGSAGIEHAMNPELSASSDAQFFSGLAGLFTGQTPAGAAVELTVDPIVQQVAWDALGDMRGSVIAIEPSTGAILGMVSKPAYDPNVLASTDLEEVEANYTALLNADGSPLVNSAIGGNMNPPGSVFKLVVAAAALESGITTPDGELPNPATWTLPGSTAVVNNPTHGSPCGPGDTTTLRTAIEFSCNIPFAQLAVQLGAGRLRDMAEALGFNHEFDVPQTSAASVYPTGGLDDAQTALTGFGQFDVRATPLQIAMVSSAIANGGVVMNPTSVEQVLTPELQELQSQQVSEYGRAFSQQTADALASMMIASVNSGVASNARIDGVDVAGKTGTAENGPDEAYSLWFTGFAASGDREIAVAVVLEDGGGMGQSGTGNGLAATIGQEVMKAVQGR